MEGAEDFDVVKSASAITVQVKKNEGSISLGNAKAHQALENFWTLSCNESSRQIDFHYLTTSTIAIEQDANFDGLPGIEAWRVAQTSTEIAATIRAYLVTKLGAKSPLRKFLETATPSDVQDRLIRRFYWLPNQPDIEVVKRSVDDRITGLLADQQRSASLATNVRKFLEARFWELVCESSLTSRCLTRGALLRANRVRHDFVPSSTN